MPFLTQCRRALALVWLAVASTACGSLLSHSDIVAADRGIGVANSAGAGSNGGLVNGGPGAKGAGPTPSLSAGPSRGDAAQRTATAPGVRETSAATGPGSSALQPSGPGDHSPLIIGSVSTMSGPIGAIQLPGVQGMQVWAAWVNAHGGVAGHPVKVYTVDDGDDPARQSAAVRDLVENKHVVAFVAQYASQTQQASVNYLTKHNIPVIGGDQSTSAGWGTSPMFFPVGVGASPAMGNGIVYANWASGGRQFVKSGKYKLGLAYCVELTVCKTVNDMDQKVAPKYGFKVVSNRSTSLTNPDYTSDCLAMQQAGVQVINVLLDANSGKRFARSCAQIGLNAQYVLPYGGTNPAMANDPNFEGSAGAYPVVPFMYFTNVRSPLVKQFNDAYATYGHGISPTDVSAAGWVAGQIFAKAVERGIGAAAPSSKGVLSGLYTIRNDTMGGATAPLTYLGGAIQKPSPCYFGAGIKDHRWIALNGMQYSCYR